jgi:hypothetical protein
MSPGFTDFTLPTAPRTAEDVAAAHLRRLAYEDEIRELSGLLRAGLGQVAPWRRQSWMTEEDAGVLELARVLHAWGVRVGR